MRNLLQHNKKGISEIVVYVLLVLIAISISSLVFFYLKSYVPKEKPECQQDITLLIQSYSCSSQLSQLNLTFLNKGLFNIDLVYIRVGSEGSRVKKLINPEYNDGPNGLYFGVIDDQKGLIPGKTFSKVYLSPLLKPGVNELEIEPAVFTGKGTEIALCDKAIVTQTITCS